MQSQGGFRGAPCAIQSLGVCTPETRPGERRDLPQNKSRAGAAICVASPPPPSQSLLPSILLPLPESRQRACAAAEQIRRRAFREVVGAGTPPPGRPNPTLRPGLSTSQWPLDRGSFGAQNVARQIYETCLARSAGGRVGGLVKRWGAEKKKS